MPNFPSVYVSFSKAFTLQLQDDLNSEYIKDRKKGDLDEALAIRVFIADVLPSKQNELYKKISNRQNRIGSFYLENNHEGWSLIHRVIIPEYRKQKIGTQILRYAEIIFQEIANI